MLPILALHFEPEYLIAGSELIPGRFHTFSMRNLSEKEIRMLGTKEKADNQRFPFFFYNTDNKIDFALAYKFPFLNGKEGFIGDFISLIENDVTINLFDSKVDAIYLLSPVLEHIIKRYQSRIDLSNRNSFRKIDYSQPIPLYISFSHNISEKVRNSIKNYLDHDKTKVEKILNFEELLVSAAVKKHKWRSTDQTVLIVNALTDDLMFTLGEFNDKYLKEKANEIFLHYGIDPGIKNIAQRIVDEANRQNGLISDEAEKQDEYVRHYKIALELIANHREDLQQGVTFNSSFKNFQEHPFLMSLTSTEISARLVHPRKLHARQIFENLQDFVMKNNLMPSQLDRILFVGNTLNNREFKEIFSTLGANRIQFIGDDDIFIALMESVAPDRLITSDQVQQEIDINESKRSEIFKEFIENKNPIEDNKKQYKNQEQNHQSNWVIKENEIPVSQNNKKTTLNISSSNQKNMKPKMVRFWIAIACSILITVGIFFLISGKKGSKETQAINNVVRLIVTPKMLNQQYEGNFTDQHGNSHKLLVIITNSQMVSKNYISFLYDVSLDLDKVLEGKLGKMDTNANVLEFFVSESNTGEENNIIQNLGKGLVEKEDQTQKLIISGANKKWKMVQL